MNNAINSFLKSLKRFFVTFYRSIFKPTTLFKNIYFTKNDEYLKPFIYLTICSIFLLSIRLATTKYQYAFLKQNDKLIQSVNDFLNDSSMLDQILYALPLSFLLFFAISVIGRILFTDKKIKEVFISMGIYWCGSFSLFFTALSFISGLIINGYINYKLKEDIDFLPKFYNYSHLFPNFFYYFQLLGYVIPIFAILNFFKTIDKRVIKFLSLSIVSGAATLTISVLIKTEIRLINFVKGDNIEIYPPSGSKFSAILFTGERRSDSSIEYSGNVYIKNKSNNDIRVNHENCFRLVLDTFNYSRNPQCAAYLSLLDTLYANITPVKSRYDAPEESYIVKPKEKILVSIFFKMKYLPFEMHCLTSQKYNISLFYSNTDAYAEDELFESPSQQFYVYLGSYDERIASDSTAKQLLRK